MSKEQEFIGHLDQWLRGSLSQEEMDVLQGQMNRDPALKKLATDHREFIEAFKTYQQRLKLQQTLNEIHAEIELTPPVTQSSNVVVLNNRKYLMTTAIAAAVALISITCTLWLTGSIWPREEANYKELRRNVEQIKKSQKLILADLAQSKGKSTSNQGKYAGTGFLISSNGYIATSYHVVKEADSITIENEKMGTLRATVVFKDAVNDIAVLKIISLLHVKSLPYILSDMEANLGENTYTLGFPREDIVFGEGSISALSGYHQNPNAYQISVPVNPGNSGGPLLNSRGDLVGVISGLQTETSGAAFAIKSTVLLEVIKEMPVDSTSESPTLPKFNQLRNFSRVDQVKRWKEFVFMVRVFK